MKIDEMGNVFLNSANFAKISEWFRTADSKYVAKVQWMYCSGGTK